MSIKTRKKRSAPESFKTSWSAYLGRMVVTIIFVTLILYVALLAASHTQGFRSLVAERFEEFTQLDVEIEQSKLTPLLHLTLGGVKASLGEEQVVPSFYIEELKIHWLPFRLFSSHAEDVLSVRGTGLTIDIQREGGEVFPACLQSLALVGTTMKLKDLQQDVRTLLLPRSDSPLGYPLELDGERMSWWNGEQREMTLENFHFSYSIHQAASPVVRLYHLRAKALRRPNQAVFGPLEIECHQKGVDLAFLKAEADTGTQPRVTTVVRQDPVAREILREPALQQPKSEDADTGGLEAYLRDSLERAVEE